MTIGDGRQFEASLFHELSRILGAHHIHTTSHHPASNRMVERVRWHLKVALCATSDPQFWLKVLPVVHLGCRSHEVNARLSFS